MVAGSLTCPQELLLPALRSLLLVAAAGPLGGQISFTPGGCDFCGPHAQRLQLRVPLGVSLGVPLGVHLGPCLRVLLRVLLRAPLGVPLRVPLGVHLGVGVPLAGISHEVGGGVVIVVRPSRPAGGEGGSFHVPALGAARSRAAAVGVHGAGRHAVAHPAAPSPVGGILQLLLPCPSHRQASDADPLLHMLGSAHARFTLLLLLACPSQG